MFDFRVFSSHKKYKNRFDFSGIDESQLLTFHLKIVLQQFFILRRGDALIMPGNDSVMTHMPRFWKASMFNRSIIKPNGAHVAHVPLRFGRKDHKTAHWRLESETRLVTCNEVGNMWNLLLNALDPLLSGRDVIPHCAENQSIFHCHSKVYP